MYTSLILRRTTSKINILLYFILNKGNYCSGCNLSRAMRIVGFGKGSLSGKYIPTITIVKIPVISIKPTVAVTVYK